MYLTCPKAGEMASEYFPCPVPEGTRDCPYFFRTTGCHEIRHHRYYPAKDYTTTLEKTFRNLPDNLVVRCHRLEDIEHAATQPPHKPTHEMMVEAISEAVNLGQIALSENQIRRVYGNA